MYLPSQVSWELTETHLIARIAGPLGDGSDDITLLNRLPNGLPPITVTFDDNTYWQLQDIIALLPSSTPVELTGTAAADYIAFDGVAIDPLLDTPVTVDAGAGDDFIQVGSSKFTAHYQQGDGYDVVSAGQSLTLVLDDILPNQVSVSWHGSDILIRIAESAAGMTDGGAIRLLNATSSSSYPGSLTQIQFANGVVWGAPELHAQVSRAFATDGDDVLDYNYELQYLALGKGNDELDGFFSFLEFEYANGDGRDTFGEYVHVEKVLLKGLDRSDVTFRQMGNDLIAFVNADPVRGIEAGRIRFVQIMDETSGPQFVFDNGHTLTFAQAVEATLDYLATNGDDIIEGTSRNDRLSGKLGADVLSGG